MKKIFNYIMLAAVALTGLTLAACSEDDLETNQYGKNVSLNVYGPQPVMRGGQLRFLGSNLDQIAQVIIPGVDPITNIEVVKAGVPSEIRVTVPKDGPEPGQVTLITKTDLKIVTKTALTYEEPIEIESITEKAMPGDVIEIKGDYLNLIHMVEFADGVRVSEADFQEHTRYLIKVAVPEEARTGKLNLYTYDIVADPEAEDNVNYNIIETEQAVAIGTPSIAKVKSPRGEAAALGTITAKLGETITIEGANLSLVKAILFGDEDGRVEVSEINITDAALTLVLPAEAPDGDVNIVCKSGVEVPVATLVTVVPTELSVNPAPVKNGELLTINGKDLDVVAAIDMPNAPGVEFNYAEGKIALTVPESAQEGDITLRMANKKEVSVAYTLVKPSVRGFSPNTVSAGGVVVVKGTNLDLVKAIKFGCDPVEVEPAADGKTITVTVPMEAVSCNPVFVLKNGTEFEVDKSLTVQEAVFCYATDLPTEDEMPHAGDVLTLTVKNIDKLVGVEVNGEAAQYIVAGEKLHIGTPSNAGRGTQVRLISSNGEITYTIDLIPNSEIVTVLWSGMGELAWSGDGQIYMGEDGGQALIDAGAKAGDLLRIKFTPTADDWCFQLWEGHWGGQYGQWGAQGDGNTPYDLEGNKGYFYFELTDDILAQLTTPGGWGGLVLVQGQGLIVTELALVQKVSMETELWKGEAIADDWGNQPTFFEDGGAELLAAGMKVGSTIRFYITPLEDAWNLQVWDGHWGGSYNDLNQDNYDLAEHKGAIELEITADIYQTAVTPQGWGNVFLLNGDNVKCTKITLE